MNTQESFTDMVNRYLDPSTQFNEYTFNSEDFYDSMFAFFLRNKIPCDDFKGRAGCTDDPLDGECYAVGTFSWIVYPEDTPKKDFAKLAKHIEKLLSNQFKDAKRFECNCVSYRNSEYSSSGYDAEMKIRISYPLLYRIHV